MAGENVVGSAYVAIRPDTSKFAAELTNLLPTTGGPLGKLIADLGPGGLLTTALIGSAVAIGAISVNLAAKFDVTQKALQANMGITAKQATAIGAAFLATGGQTTFSAQEMLTAFAPVSRQLSDLNHGALSTSQSLTFMQAAMALAEATGQPLNDVTAALVRTMIAYKQPLSDAAGATDILTNSSISLNQPVTDISTAIDKLAGRLGAATPPLADVAALMVDLFKAGIPARLAVSGAALAITSLELPSKSGAAMIKALNLQVLDSHGKFVGLDSIIAQLNPKFRAMTQNQQLATAAFLFGKPAAAAMVTIIDQGIKPYTSLAAAVSKVGSAQADANTKTDTLAGTWAKFKSGIADLGTKFGQLLTPILAIAAKTGLPAINAALGWLIDNKIVLEALFISIAGSFVLWAGTGAIATLLNAIIGATGGIATFGAVSKVAVAPWLALAAVIYELKNIPGQFGATPIQPIAAGQSASPGGKGLLNGNLGGFGFGPLNVPHRAGGGGIAPFGLSWVGETGKELIQAGAQGAHVYSNAQSKGMTSGVHQVNNFYGVGKETVDIVKGAIADNNMTLIRHLAAAR